MSIYIYYRNGGCHISDPCSAIGVIQKKDRESVFKFVFILCAICLPDGTYPSGDFLQYGKCYQCDRRICRSGYPWYP